jgi:tetratricopeptide (TPR) repeat protein
VVRAAAAALLASLLLASPARADEHDTWAEIVDPHGDEIRQILDKAQQAWMQALNYANYDGDPTGEARTKLMDDAYGMLRYARRLSPHNVEVLLLLGKVADDGGRTKAAIEALEAYAREAPQPVAEAHQRLGKLYLRLRKYDLAIRHLRQGLVGGQSAATTVYLATALTAVGRGDDATQLLADAVQAQGGQYWNVEVTTLGLALAVAYDRDEQLSSAFQTLDHMQSALNVSYASQLQQSIGSVQFVPAIDQRYWQALFYESNGFLAEARAEWLNYAAGGAEARWKDRALAHVAAIDKLRAAELAARRAGKNGPPKDVVAPVPRRYQVP